MKFLAEGYYYRVYEAEGGRVLKKPQSYWYSLSHIYFTVIKVVRSPLRAILAAHRAVLTERDTLRKMKRRIAEMPSWIFANTEFLLDSLAYTQDRVTTIEKYLSVHTLEENKKIIDGYLDLQKIFWSYGMHDAVFKFQPNYGVDKEGRVVCIDVGEFVFVKEKALETIQKKKWLLRPSYRKWSEHELKSYYTERMEEVMMEENLFTHWRDWKEEGVAG